jgi:hypothetical protein
MPLDSLMNLPSGDGTDLEMEFSHESLDAPRAFQRALGIGIKNDDTGGVGNSPLPRPSDERDPISNQDSLTQLLPPADDYSPTRPLSPSDDSLRPLVAIPQPVAPFIPREQEPMAAS